MIDPSLGLVGAGISLIPMGMAFSKAIRYELLKRDRWTCQSEYCFGNYIGQGELDWKNGWNVNAAHYPELHQRGEDKNMENGRCLCVNCHLIEELNRGNYGGAGLLYQNQTIRNKEWLSVHGWKDEKMEFSWYLDFAKSDERGRLGLIDAYVERFSHFELQGKFI